MYCLNKKYSIQITSIQKNTMSKIMIHRYTQSHVITYPEKDI